LKDTGRVDMTAKWIERYYYKYSIVEGVVQVKQVRKVLNDEVPLAPQKQTS
jgi:hypothetical protein